MGKGNFPGKSHISSLSPCTSFVCVRVCAFAEFRWSSLCCSIQVVRVWRFSWKILDYALRIYCAIPSCKEALMMKKLNWNQFDSRRKRLGSINFPGLSSQQSVKIFLFLHASMVIIINSAAGLVFACIIKMLSFSRDEDHDKKFPQLGTFYFHSLARRWRHHAGNCRRSPCASAVPHSVQSCSMLL